MPDDIGSDDLAVVVAQTIASAEAQAIQPATQSEPPLGCHALTSIRTLDGEPLDTAIVMGYAVTREDVRDVVGPDGQIRLPGDSGFLDAQMARLTHGRMPPGWEIRTRSALVLYALIDGNPMLLEEQARERGYPRAIASSPKWLCLGEVSC